MQCKAVLDPGFYAVDSEFHVLELGFRISIVHRIPDSLSWVAVSKARDSGFHYQKFPGFWNPGDLPYMGQMIYYQNRIMSCRTG